MSRENGVAKVGREGESRNVGRECGSRNVGRKTWVANVGHECGSRMVVAKWGRENKKIGGVCKWDPEGSSYLIKKCVPNI